MLFSFRTTTRIDLVILISMFCVCPGCSGSDKDQTKVNVNSGVINTYVLQGVPKTRLFLNDNGSFDYISIDRKNFPDDLFFKTSGRWRKKGDTVYLTSIVDNLDMDTASVVKLPAVDSAYSVIRFHDIYNDSIGFMYVTYPDGRDYNQGSDMGDRLFDWSSNLKKVAHLEFHFVNYERWKYYSDGKNYNLNVYLKPKFKSNVFKDEKYVLNGDTLTKVSNPSMYIFIKEENDK